MMRFIVSLLVLSILFVTPARADFCPLDKVSLKVHAIQIANNGKRSKKLVSITCGVNEAGTHALLVNESSAQCRYVTATSKITALQRQIARLKNLSFLLRAYRNRLIREKTNLVNRVQAARVKCKNYQFDVAPLTVQSVTLAAGIGKTTTINLLSVNSNLPANATLGLVAYPHFVSLQNGVLAITPSASNVGTHTVLYQAIAGNRVSNTGTITITVTGSSSTPTPTPTMTPGKPNPDSLTPYTDQITADEARLLFRKIGFGATKLEIGTAVNVGLSTMVDRLVERCKPTHSSFKSVDTQAKAIRNAKMPKETGTTKYAERAYLLTHFRYGSPVCAAMFMILHNRFAVDQTSNMNASARRHVAENYRKLIFENTVGQFDMLLSRIHRDASMIDWLNNDDNTKESLNQNYGREVMELFSLGTFDAVYGDKTYSENDVNEMTKAMTGFDVLRNSTTPMQSAFDLSRHFSNDVHLFKGIKIDGKSFYAKGKFRADSFGAAANSFGNDTVTPYLLYNHPSAPRNLAITLLGHFVSPEVSTDLIEATAQLILNEGYNLEAVLKVILKSQALFAQQNQGRAFISPVEHVMSAARSLNLPIFADTTPKNLELGDALAGAMDIAGQGLLTPPTVFGWNMAGTFRNGKAEDGSDFLTTDGLRARKNAIHTLMNRLREADRFNGAQILVQTNDATNPTIVVTDLAKALGVSLDEAQQSELAEYISSVRFDDGSVETGAWEYIRTHDEVLQIKLSGLISLLTSSEEANIK